ncbi:MAG TPA: hypothetical protein VK439_03580, partial [Rubrivivax sp.]|nr:hypothetical protein [Rubrivivax sp.]
MARSTRWSRIWWPKLSLALCLTAGALGLPQAATASTAADTKPAPAPVPVEHFFQHPAVLEAKLSPSGKRVALTTSRNSPRVGLAVIDLTSDVKPRYVAGFIDADITKF